MEVIWGSEFPKKWGYFRLFQFTKFWRQNILCPWIFGHRSKSITFTPKSLHKNDKASVYFHSLYFLVCSQTYFLFFHTVADYWSHALIWCPVVSHPGRWININCMIKSEVPIWPLRMKYNDFVKRNWFLYGSLLEFNLKCEYESVVSISGQPYLDFWIQTWWFNWLIY